MPDPYWEEFGKKHTRQLGLPSDSDKKNDLRFVFMNIECKRCGEFFHAVGTRVLCDDCKSRKNSTIEDNL
jgi:predicted Zn-ribbon and HTH transcriptional regulator